MMTNVWGGRATAMSLDERCTTFSPDARCRAPLRQDERPGRKVGHINFLVSTRRRCRLRERAELAAHWLSHGQWTDGWDPHG
ncbi:phosphoribosylaminoimidazole carboxylase, ATPase subunit domain protein [Mycobacterium ulcerans str. Harvey]|uniref:Phosphoribosylaminoimidazole carboxylase, ATPase subunit domain protein n=1 Tax=Mycobacterium ulcerans str. Harvey TaxID=1299332 RepID=A0ABP3AQ38_MYCUL|nr:phosphoribosylaminoimidazole carboxylase, ATPase subunit domain protein [Mycobacterium ulcerans str. Harvey]